MLSMFLLTLLQPSTPAAPPPLHPTITEVLYAVPKDADPDQDGRRSPTGDEFIELFNPHDKPISLKGYRLSDAKVGPDKPRKGDKPPPSENSFRFTFPDLTLQPGEVVVVFNGYQSSPAGPVGTKDAPAVKNPKFNNAYVFTAQVTSQYVAMANNGDCITLCDPDGKPIECVYWGEKQQPAPAAAQFKAPESRGSVQRPTPKADFVAHQNLPGADADLPFSPGKFELPKDPPRTPADPPASSSPASTPTPR